MPIYEYECRKCGVFDYEQSIADRPLARCPKCRSKVTKLISASAFHLKGGGWYADGYDRKTESSAASKEDTSGSTGATGDAAAAGPTPPAKKKKQKTKPNEASSKN